MSVVGSENTRKKRWNNLKFLLSSEILYEEYAKHHKYGLEFPQFTSVQIASHSPSKTGKSKPKQLFMCACFFTAWKLKFSASIFQSLKETITNWIENIARAYTIFLLIFSLFPLYRFGYASTTYSWFKFTFAHIKITFHSTEAIIRLCNIHSFGSFSILVGVRLCLFVIHFFQNSIAQFRIFKSLDTFFVPRIFLFQFRFVYNFSC